MLLALREGGEGISHEIFEPDDGRAHGWSHPDLARSIGTAVGRKVHVVPLPDFALKVAAYADEKIRGRNARLTRDRASYLAHKDWVVAPERAARVTSTCPASIDDSIARCALPPLSPGRYRVQDESGREFGAIEIPEGSPSFAEMRCTPVG